MADVIEVFKRVTVTLPVSAAGTEATQVGDVFDVEDYSGIIAQVDVLAASGCLGTAATWAIQSTISEDDYPCWTTHPTAAMPTTAGSSEAVAVTTSLRRKARFVVKNPNTSCTQTLTLRGRVLRKVKASS